MVAAADHQTPTDPDRIALIAKVIRDTYGDDAIEVAERQIEVAEHALRDDWIAIRDRLQI